LSFPLQNQESKKSKTGKSDESSESHWRRRTCSLAFVLSAGKTRRSLKLARERLSTPDKRIAVDGLMATRNTQGLPKRPAPYRRIVRPRSKRERIVVGDVTSILNQARAQLGAQSRTGVVIDSCSAGHARRRNNPQVLMLVCMRGAGWLPSSIWSCRRLVLQDGLPRITSQYRIETSERRTRPQGIRN
jgi:hypothetical protein